MIEITDESFYYYTFSKLKSKYIEETEFKNLLKHIVYIKRLFKKYKDNPKNININLLLNHFIVLYNEIEINSANIILFYKINSIYYPQLKTILLNLHKIKNEEVIQINQNNIVISDILIDIELEIILNKIFL